MAAQGGLGSMGANLAALGLVSHISCHSSLARFFPTAIFAVEKRDK
jgi:hypothetical protein